MTKKEALVRRCLSFCRKTPAHERWIAGICRWLPWSMVVLYFTVVCLQMLFWDTERVVRVLVIPFSGLWVASIVRHRLNKPRPYDVNPELVPLLQHHSGHSFPSRHAVSSALISVTCLYFWWPLGIVAVVAALSVAVTRLLCVVHFLRDVCTGPVFGWVWGTIFFFIV